MKKGIIFFLTIIIGVTSLLIYWDKKETTSLAENLGKFKNEAFLDTDSSNSIDEFSNYTTSKKSEPDKQSLIKLTGLDYSEAINYVSPEYVTYNNLGSRIKLLYPNYLDAHTGDLNDTSLVSKAQTFDENSENIPVANISLRIHCYKNIEGYSEDTLYDKVSREDDESYGKPLKSKKYGIKKISDNTIVTHYVKSFGEDAMILTFYYEKSLEDICNPQWIKIIDSIEQY